MLGGVPARAPRNLIPATACTAAGAIERGRKMPRDAGDVMLDIRRTCGNGLMAHGERFDRVEALIAEGRRLIVEFEAARLAAVAKAEPAPDVGTEWGGPKGKVKGGKG